MIQNDEFIEHATFSNNTYGTSKAAVKTVVEQGKICILDIVSVNDDLKKFVKVQFPSNDGIFCNFHIYVPGHTGCYSNQENRFESSICFYQTTFNGRT